MIRIAISLSLLLALCGFLLAETIAWQGFEQTPEDTWTYQANSIGSGYWGLMDDVFGGASPQSGSQYWASWNMGGNEGIISFANQNLPVGYVYSLSFYFYTRLLSSPAEYSRYCLSYDNGLTWTDWTTLLPNTQAWTLVSLEIPVQHRQLMLKVAAKHGGTSKYAHWDSFLLSRVPAPPQAPVIYNLQIAQRVDGSGLADIQYDLFDANNNPADISLLLSNNAGASFDISPGPAFLSGDIGPNIPLGTGKHIVWNAGAQGIALEGDQYRFRLLAEDGTDYGTVATPVFDPPGGSYNTAQEVSITCATDGATIYYTTDGSEPTEDYNLYITPISIYASSSLKAKAFKSGLSPSDLCESEYIITPVLTGFVFVPGGTYTMGRTTGSGDNDELPIHSVTLDSYSIGNCEVTQSEWQAVMGSNPTSGYGVGDNYPVHYVSWYDILKYCNLLSMNEGLTPVYSISGSTDPANWGMVPTSDNATWNAAICNWSANGYRLPTEAEWEYAARGSSNNPDYLYSGSDDINAVAWYGGNNTSGGSPTGAKPVGTKSPNGLGLYDMSGNLYEYCWDWYGSTYYSSSPSNNPTGPASGSSRVRRGGYFNDGAYYSRVVKRLGISPYYRYNGVGFRLCRSTDRMVLVEGGTFNNGTSDVTLSSFYIDKYETTQASYQAVMGINPSYFAGNPNRPVEQVSWFNAIEYCNRRSMQEGLTPCYSYSTYGSDPDDWPSGWNSNAANNNNVSCVWTANGYRVPTEMEWMFAAKGGNQSLGYTYSGSNTIGNVAWYTANSNSHTWDIGLKASNELGIFDMSGNLWEWVWDIDGYYPSGPQTNPTGPTSGGSRVKRGGGWISAENYCSVTRRLSLDAVYMDNCIGFRCSRIAQ